MSDEEFANICYMLIGTIFGGAMTMFYYEVLV